MTDTPVNTTVEKWTRQFIALRDAVKAMDDAHKTARKELTDLQDILQGKIQTFMSENNLENMKTAAGTCYVSTRYSASLADPEAFMNFVVRNELFDLLDRRANTTAVKAYVKKHNTLPPGCNLSGIAQIGVRRASGSETPDE